MSWQKKLGQLVVQEICQQWERDAEHIRSIHQALQTATQALQAATMIEASSKKYDAENYKIAIVIVTALGVIAAWVAIFAK